MKPNNSVDPNHPHNLSNLNQSINATDLHDHNTNLTQINETHSENKSES